MSLLRSNLAAPPRTLVDIFRDTVAAYPDADALDNGASVLTYLQFAEAADDLADELSDLGIGPGDKVGVRIASGTTDLYVAIMAILLAGAAYVPVDADDPAERARTVFAESDARAVIGNQLEITPRGGGRTPDRVEPAPADDAWVIFTSGSTGKPKGVAVSHRSAAAFVDAESRLFVVDAPLEPGDRVMAGSVGRLRRLVRGDVAGLAARRLPGAGAAVTGPLRHGSGALAARQPDHRRLHRADPGLPVAGEALRRVRLLILGGEACPPELGARLVTDAREVWNTYGPTEATVVACGARLTGAPPIRIGLPLDGWDLAVVDPAGHPVPPGETGELIIGGVGLARYLDPMKDAEKYGPLPPLGWSRAYRSGDLVVNDDAGLLFVGRADDQVKVGGRRIELGEIDNALLGLPGRERCGGGRAAHRVRQPVAGRLSRGRRTASTPAPHWPPCARTCRRHWCPRLAVVAELPTRTSGKIDRDALPWPLPDDDAPGATLQLSGTRAMVRGHWEAVLGARVGTSTPTSSTSAGAR